MQIEALLVRKPTLPLIGHSEDIGRWPGHLRSTIFQALACFFSVASAQRQRSARARRHGQSSVRVRKLRRNRQYGLTPHLTKGLCEGSDRVRCSPVASKFDRTGLFSKPYGSLFPLEQNDTHPSPFFPPVKPSQDLSTPDRRHTHTLSRYIYTLPQRRNPPASKRKRELLKKKNNLISRKIL